MRTLGFLLAFAALSATAQTHFPGNPFGSSASPAQTGPSKDAAKGIDVNVPASQSWTDTGIDIRQGDDVTIEVSGQIKFAAAAQGIGPTGARRGWLDQLKTYPVNDAGRGALIARIGQPSAARPFLVGERRQFRAQNAGRLFLGMNYSGSDSGEGSFTARVTVTAGAAAIDVSKLNLPELTQRQLDSIPVRVMGHDGTPGDRTNFVIIGSEQKMKSALDAAGWVIVDRTVKDTILTGALAVLNRKAYLTIPMSELYLFDRPQDYGYAHADPISVVAARHHFRVWKAPWTLNGSTVWVGAGTHDVGFDRDQRNGKLTHKIDPDTDGEREFIAQSLREVGAVVKSAYLTPANPITTAKTAHGQEFRSDGRTLILWLTPDGGSDASQSFSDLFCSVLQQGPDAQTFGACTEWLRLGGKTNARLDKLSTAYRVLIVPGFFNTCASDAPAYLEGQESLKKMGLTVELLSVPNSSSEDNAKQIGQYLRDQFKTDKRPYLLLGYSKGTPDIQVMLATQPDVRPYVKAFLSVAGASGGSPVADALPGMLDKYIALGNDKAEKAGCKGNMEAGLASLKREVRQRFLQAYPDPFVPTYSLAAVADPDKLAANMKKTYMIVSASDKDNDDQLTKGDATIPGSKFLGIARSDHFALALPLEKSKMGSLTAPKEDQKPKYPRAALLEALVRFVITDLDAKQ